jgi:hypothetical protein
LRKGIEDIERTIVALGAMTRTDVPFTIYNEDCDSYFPEVLDSISRNIPHTRRLKLIGVDVRFLSSWCASLV